jgi:hypothetical protein
MSVVTKRAGIWEFTGPLDVDGVTITGDNCTGVVVGGEDDGIGRKYQGGLLKSLYHGNGTFTWSSGENYNGEWKNDTYDGKGVFTFVSGQTYVGEYKDGKNHGKGVHTWPSGQRYEGEYKDDKYNGKGVMSWPATAAQSLDMMRVGDKSAKGHNTNARSRQRG